MSGGQGDTSPLQVKQRLPLDEDSEDPGSGVHEEEQKPCLLRYITALSRTVGVILLCTLWLFTGLLMNHLSYYKYAPWYMLGVSILTTIFEPIWMINKCVISCIKHKCCCHQRRHDGCCCRFWRFLVWIDTWRKTILYIAFAIPCFLQDIATTETIIAGLLLIVTAVFYFIKSFKDSQCARRKKIKHAVVQTSPKASLVSHSVQLGKNGSHSDYHSTHTLPSTVQPQDHLSKSRQSLVDGEPPSNFLDPSGRKQQRYSEEDVRAPEGKRGSPALSGYGSDNQYSSDRRERYGGRDRDRYDDNPTLSRHGTDDRYSDEHRERYGEREGDRYDSPRASRHGSYRHGGSDWHGGRDRERYDDSHPLSHHGKDDRYADDRRERHAGKGGERYDDSPDLSRHGSDRHSGRDGDSDRYIDRRDRYGDRDRYRERQYSDDESDRRGRYDDRDSADGHRRTGWRDGSRDRPPSRYREPSPKPLEKQQAPPGGPPAASPPPVKEKEIPPLKELPPQASEGLKTSAAATLVKQVSSGSIVLTTTGSNPSGMPGKVEQRAAKMANPLAGTNPFDEPDEDEYFD